MKNPIVSFKLSKMFINMFRCNWIRTVYVHLIQLEKKYFLKNTQF